MCLETNTSFLEREQRRKNKSSGSIGCLNRNRRNCLPRNNNFKPACTSVSVFQGPPKMSATKEWRPTKWHPSCRLPCIQAISNKLHLFSFSRVQYSFLWRWDSRTWFRGSRNNTTQCQSQAELSITDAKRVIVNYRFPKGKDVHCTSYKKLSTPATQPGRHRHHPALLLFCNGLSFKIIPPNFLPPLHKITFLSFVYWTCHIACVSQTAFLCYS